MPCRTLQFVKDTIPLNSRMDRTQAMQEAFLQASHYTPEETEGPSGPKVRELRLGSRSRNQCQVPNFQGSILTKLGCLVCRGAGNPPSGWTPKGLQFLVVK